MPVSPSNLSWHHNGANKLLFLPFFFQTLVLVLALYLLRQPVSSPLLKLPFAIAILVSWFFLPKPFYHPIFWATWLAYFLILLVRDFYGVANHHFVACYILIANIQYTASNHHPDKILQFHIRFILMIVLLFSAFQKLLSPSYIKGTFLQFEMYMDVFFEPMKFFIPGWKNAVHENLAAYKHLKLHHPATLETVKLKEPISNAFAIAKICSWIGIFIEALAGIALFFRSNHRISHILLLTMVAGVFFLRLETGFLAMICCMGLLLSPSKGWKNVWLFCFILFAAMIATGAGVR
jgi:hypothetical protein